MILRPKETYDGAIPSGNALMAWNLVRLSQISENEEMKRDAERQLDFLAGEAAQYPAGHAMFLLALLDYKDPPTRIIVVTAKRAEVPPLASEAVVRLLDAPTQEYPLKNGRTTFYVCRNHSCLPPSNELTGV